MRSWGLAVRAPAQRVIVAGALALALGACSSAATLDVSLRTDMPGGREFTEIRTELRRDSGEVVRAAQIPASAPADWTHARRVAELGDLPPGDLLLNVTLFEESGRVAAQRTVRVTIAQERVALTVLITRDCRGVSCPGSGDSAVETSCLGGRCVSPDCSELDPMACPPPLCHAASDCPTPVVSCAVADCVEGVCISVPNGTCRTDEYCDLVEDCTPVGGGPVDASVGDTGGPDAGTSGCTDGLPCDTGDVCALGRTHCVGGVPQCMPSEPAPASTPCRTSAGACDVAETCGGAMTCPPDALAPSTTECHASAGECDAAELCTGASVDCPSDRNAPDGTLCSAGVCNLGMCVPCSAGLPCSTGRACERGAIDCSGATPTCTAAGALGAGTSCRDALGPCDATEVCDGTSHDCPADGFRPTSFVCRPSADVCDAADTCSGSSAACPADAFASSAMVCRAAAGACDLDDHCSGTSATCPGDLLRGVGYGCRAAADVCDLPDVCDGSSSACPSDAHVSAGTTCRGMVGLCDAPEACDGTHSNCPADGYAGGGTTCRSSVGECDATETCTGGSPACPADRSQPDGDTCSGGVCASGTCQPCTSGLPCTRPSPCERGSIDCSSGAPVCVGAGPQLASTVCRPAVDVCDHAESCDGSSLACPADTFLNGPTCRMAASACDVAEACDGSGPACPHNDVAPDGTPCGVEGCPMFGPCTGMGCNLAMGSQQRTCTTPSCVGGGCFGTVPRTDTQSCTRTDQCGDACCHGDELGDTCSMDCGPMPTTVVGGPSMYPPLIGGAGGMTFEDVCPDGMIISALNIDYSPSAGGVTWLEGISAFCGPLQFSRTGSPAQLAVTTGYQYANITPMRGGNGGATILCPVGSVATGLDAGIDPTGPYVRAIDMHCSPIGITGNTAATAVFSFGAPTHLILVINAGPPGTLLPGDCPAGTVARGLRGGYDPLTLWSIGFVCQSITAM